MPTLDYQLPSFPITPAQFAQRCKQSSQMSKFMFVARFLFPAFFFVAIQKAFPLSPILPALDAYGLKSFAIGILAVLLGEGANSLLNLHRRHLGLRCPTCDQAIFHRRSLLLPSGHCPCCNFHILDVPPEKPHLTLPVVAQYSDVTRLSVLLISILVAGALAIILYLNSADVVTVLLASIPIGLIIVGYNLVYFVTRFSADATGLHARSPFSRPKSLPWSSIRTPLTYSTNGRRFIIPIRAPSTGPPPKSPLPAIPPNLDGINDLLYLIHHPPISPPD